MSQLFTWGGPSTGLSALASVLPKKSQDWSPSEWTGWISLQSKGPPRVFFSTTFESLSIYRLCLMSPGAKITPCWKPVFYINRFGKVSWHGKYPREILVISVKIYTYACVCVCLSLYIYIKSRKNLCKVNMSSLKNKTLGQKELNSELYAMLKR